MATTRERLAPLRPPLAPPPRPRQGPGWRRLDALPDVLRGTGSRYPLLRHLAPWLLIGAFVAQAAILLPNHQPWFDEAQAWLLARDAGLVELFTERLRYEGSPGLWHLLLMVPAKLGAPYVTMQVIGVAAATAGATLLAFRSPFPLVLRAGLLFSFIIGYQYASVARSYTLFPLLLWIVALTYPQRTERPGRFALALGLLANVSLHGLIVAGCIAALQGVTVLRQWRDLEPGLRRRTLAAGGALLTMALLLVVVLWPPADLGAASGANISLTNWLIAAPLMLNTSLTGNPLVSAAAVAVSGYWFWRTRTLLLWLLPTVALLTLSVWKYHSYWHDGIPFLVWVFALWVSLKRPRLLDRRLAWERLAALGALAAVLVVQGAWWWNSYRFDLTNTYSASEDLAAYLETLEPGTTVVARGWHAAGALPYLDHNPFDNFNDGELPGYVVWDRDVELTRPVDLSEEPDVIVWGLKTSEDIARIPREVPGYGYVDTLDGHLYWKNRITERDAFVIYERR